MSDKPASDIGWQIPHSRPRTGSLRFLALEDRIFRNNNSTNKTRKPATIPSTIPSSIEVTTRSIASRIGIGPDCAYIRKNREREVLRLIPDCIGWTGCSLQSDTDRSKEVDR